VITARLPGSAFCCAFRSTSIRSRKSSFSNLLKAVPETSKSRQWSQRMIRPSKSGGVRLLAGSSQTGHGMDGIERSILYYNRHGSDEPSAPRPKPASAWPPARAAGRSLRQWPSITRRLRGWQGRTAPRVRGRTDAVISTAAPLSGLSRRGGQAP
jgi:hypothetical protein